MKTISCAPELLVAGLYYLSPAGHTDTTRIVAPYATVRAPLTIRCRR